MSRPHVIVIGAGMGGLAAAADLAGRGAKVNLLERHAGPGGKMREVTAGGRPIDSGPTVFTMRWIFDGLFSDQGRALEDYVTIQSAEHLARHAWLDGSRLDLYTDTERSVEAVRAFTGDRDAAAYALFVADSGRVFDTLDATFMRATRPSMLELSRRVGFSNTGDLLATRPFVSLWNDLRARFTDTRLVQLFARYATYCGSSPFAAPATLMLIAEAERRGVWYVDGGMQRFAEGLARFCTDAGAELQFSTGVAEIVQRRGKVTGVVTDNGDALDADAVVYAGDADALAAGALGKEVARAIAPRRPIERTLSAVTLSLSGQIRGWELAHHTVLFGNNYRDEFDAIFKRGELPEAPTLYLCAQDRESRPDGAPTTERLFILMNAPPKELPAETLTTARERIAEQLTRHGIELSVADDASVLTSPNDFSRNFPGSHGSLYGRVTHGWRGSFQRSGATTSVKGLYLAGGSVHPGAGIPMATQSGRLAAAALAEALALKSG